MISRVVLSISTIQDAISSLTTLVNVVCMGQCQKEVLSLANERTVTVISMDDLEAIGVNNQSEFSILHLQSLLIIQFFKHAAITTGYIRALTYYNVAVTAQSSNES